VLATDLNLGPNTLVQHQATPEKRDFASPSLIVSSLLLN
jgi:hypothetical protein